MTDGEKHLPTGGKEESKKLGTIQEEEEKDEPCANVQVFVPEVANNLISRETIVRNAMAKDAIAKDVAALARHVSDGSNCSDAFAELSDGSCDLDSMSVGSENDTNQLRATDGKSVTAKLPQKNQP